MVNGEATVTDALERCRRQLSELRAHGCEVTALLRDLSRGLLDDGCPPSAADIELLSRFRAEFEQLQRSVPQSGTSLPRDEGDSSFTILQDELESQTLIQATLSKLASVAMIQHAEQPEFAPWQCCLDDGTRLREELLSVPATQARVTAEQFLTPQTPLNAIVTLVADGDGLSDERWTLLLDSVSAAYGREVSTAIARGKLILTSGTRA